MEPGPSERGRAGDEVGQRGRERERERKRGWPRKGEEAKDERMNEEEEERRRDRW